MIKPGSLVSFWHASIRMWSDYSQKWGRMHGATFEPPQNLGVVISVPYPSPSHVALILVGSKLGWTWYSNLTHESR